jgi:antitoxin component of MazEF toxin-antitoxin module
MLALEERQSSAEEVPLPARDVVAERLGIHRGDDVGILVSAHLRKVIDKVLRIGLAERDAVAADIVAKKDRKLTATGRSVVDTALTISHS